MDLRGIVVAQILVGSLGAVLQAHFALLLTGDRRISLMAGLLAALSMIGMAFSSFLLSETVFVVLVQIALIFLCKGLANDSAKLLLVSGLVLALAALTRSVAQFLPLLFLPLIIGWPKWSTREVESGHKRRLLRSTLFLVIPVALIVGWTARNSAVYETPHLSLAGPIGLNKTTILALSRAHGISYGEADSIYWQQVVTKRPDLTHDRQAAVVAVAFPRFVVTTL
jgi:hypothetical protein